jgi:cobalt-precorrin 5A hydrolase / precorrin-3B C17-methyltransferase
MNVITVTVSELGRRLARTLPFESVHGNPAAVLADRWDNVDAIVMVLALGATVRLIAPHLTDKARDPAVVCVDDAGAFAVVVCGGHGAGGNALARQIEGLIGARAVITTASDRLDLPGLDQLNGFAASGDLARAGAGILSGDPVIVDNPLGWPLTEPLRALERIIEPEESRATTVRLVVSDHMPAVSAPNECSAYLHPPSLVVGVGTSSNATSETVARCVVDVLAAAGLAVGAVGTVATIDRRAAHPAVLGLVEHLGAELVTWSSEQLNACAVANPSETVRRAVGTGSVAEAAALLGAGPGGELLVAKTAGGEDAKPANVTVAIARRRAPKGSLRVVGLGPGDPAYRSAAAVTAVRHAQVIIGYSAYVEQCADLCTPGQQIETFALGAELDRVRRALDLAHQGFHVTLVCSGDPGIYAMASPLLELVAPGPQAEADAVDITVVPGTTAANAAAAALGAPLGHDHLVLSLSDLHTPWDVIERRVLAGAQADLVIVLYNPRSAARTWQIEKVQSILLEHRGAATPVGVVTDAARSGELVEITTLGELDCSRVTMTTCVIIGSSTTRIIGGRMVTPRGYPIERQEPRHG